MNFTEAKKMSGKFYSFRNISREGKRKEFVPSTRNGNVGLTTKLGINKGQ